MLDFNHILSTPGIDVQYFIGQSTATLTQWQTWRKPRGVKNIYILGVGGGSSGAVGANTAATNAGGAGGGSGGQTCVWIPAMFVPDVLYVQAGAGGQQPAVLVSGATQVGGVPTYVALEPSTTLTANMTLLLANGGVAGAVTGGTLATIAGMPLAARGLYSFFVGMSGTTGGVSGNGTGANLTFPATGLMVMGGAGGGGGGSPTGGTGGALSVPVGSPYNDFFLFTYPGGSGATGATPAGSGAQGAPMRNFIMNYSGMGGGGASDTSGGQAGAGGNGSPGSGGGGSGGSTTVTGANTLARPGNGGDGFVIILSW
jgi:hypothetical protein